MSKQSLLTTVPLLLWVGIMLVGTSLPGSVENEPLLFPHADKALHFAGYGMFGFLFFRFVQFRWPSLPAPVIGWSLAIAAAYALFDELHQMLVPRRDASFWDFLADCSGFSLVFLIFVFRARRRHS